MNERDALPKAVCDNPDDDTPRLVFADWLQENGDANDRARAEFIRLQVELARGRLPATDRIRAVSRVVELLTANDERWRAAVPQLLGASVCGSYDRGFLATVQVHHWEAFRPSVADVFRSVPVTWLEIWELADPGELAEFPCLERLGRLSIGVRSPALASLVRFVAATNLRSLRSVTIAGKKLPAEQEALLANRFVSGLSRPETLSY